MIQCPYCHNTLPDWSKSCQFCHADVTKVSRPAAPRQTEKPLLVPREKWVMPMYYAVATWFLIGGLLTMATAFTQRSELGLFTSVLAAMGGVNVILGLGLAARVELIRGVVNFVCGLNIIFGLLSLPSAVMGTLFSGVLGAILTFRLLIDLVTNALMIYLIGETEKHAPNI